MKVEHTGDVVWYGEDAGGFAGHVQLAPAPDDPWLETFNQLAAHHGHEAPYAHDAVVQVRPTANPTATLETVGHLITATNRAINRPGS